MEVLLLLEKTIKQSERLIEILKKTHQWKIEKYKWAIDENDKLVFCLLVDLGNEPKNLNFYNDKDDMQIILNTIINSEVDMPPILKERACLFMNRYGECRMYYEKREVILV